MRRHILLCCFLGLALTGIAAGPDKKPAGSKQMIYLEHAGSLLFDEGQSKEYQVLVDDVRFRHDSAWMYCDTAHYYQQTNSLYAFGNVRIEQGDTLFLYGNTLYYDGNKMMAQMRGKVRMMDPTATLYTDHLDYDRRANIGYYFGGGRIVDSTNVLSSDFGQYNPGTNMAFFKKKVTLTHPQFVMKTDTLNYNTQTHVASIVSHTVITSDNSVVHAFRGWYNTATDNSLLLDHSYVCSSPNYMSADSLFYKQLQGIGEGFRDVVIVDSAKAMTLTADYGYYNKEKEQALLTRQALLREYSGRDTLFLHADTLMTQKDSVFDTFRAFHHVRCFRSDLQGVCDSIFYSSRDSVMDMNGAPIIWADEQMVRGNHMKLYVKNSAPDYLHVERNAITIQQEMVDTSYFNQSSGDDLKAYFENSQVRRIVVEGDCQSIYLPHDDDENIIGMNRLEQGNLTITMNDEGKMESILVSPNPKGKFYPLKLVSEKDKRLPLFSWPADIRPTGPEDVFRREDKQDDTFVDQKLSGQNGSTRSNRNRDRRAKGSLKTLMNND